MAENPDITGITKESLLSLFVPGEVIKTERAAARISKLNSAYIYLDRINGGNSFTIRPENVLCVLSNLDEIEHGNGSIEARIQKVLHRHTRPENAVNPDSSSETYLYAFAKELDRRARPKTIEDCQQDFEALVSGIENLSIHELRKGASLFPQSPLRVDFKGATLYHRNPYVVRLALARANGRCERCAEVAPFLRSTNDSPYLEVHHKIWLSKGGKDIESNTLALCPNCHRFLHHGHAEA